MPALHIAYRPEDFDEVVGNQELVQSLKSLLTRAEDIPHAFLLQGPSGCGKTTIARIIKKHLKCHDQDFTEINAANSRGIETARDIIRSCQYLPVGGPTRVILLDEVHMGTRDFQNALLKPLEDTPAHVFFILCTTDPQKLILTVRNRCSVFEVQKLSDDEMKDLLEWVLMNEEIHLGKELIQQIITAVEGCARQALVILDQIIDLPAASQEKAIREAVIGDKQVIELCRALIKGAQWREVATILKGIKEDPEKVRYAVMGYMNSVLLNGNGKAAVIMDCFREPFFYAGKALLTLACYESLG